MCRAIRLSLLTATLALAASPARAGDVKVDSFSYSGQAQATYSRPYDPMAWHGPKADGPTNPYDD